MTPLDHDQIAPHELAKILRDDVEYYDTAMRQYLERLYRLLLLVFPVVGIAVSALYRYEQFLPLLLIPILTSLSILVGASLTAEMYGLAAHKMFLEQSLFTVLRTHLPAELRINSTVPWDEAGGYLVPRTLGNKLLWILFPLMVVAGSGVAIVVAWLNLDDRWYLAAISVPVSIGLHALALLALAKCPSVYHQTLAKLNELRHHSDDGEA